MKVTTILFVPLLSLIISSNATKTDEFCKGVSLADNSGGQLGGTNTQELSSAAGSNTNVVKSMQEWRGENRLKNVMIEGESAQTYGTTIGAYAAWGIILAVLTFLCCICTNVGRLFNCKCCFRPTKVYDKKEKLMCVALYTIFAVACGVCCILGLVALTGFVNGLGDILCEFEDLRVGAKGFFEGMLKPLDRLQTVGIKNINYIDANLGPADVVGNNTNHVIKLFQDYSTNVGAVNVHPNYTCGFCQGVAADANQTGKELNDQVKPGVTAMEDTATVLNAQLVAANTTIVSVVASSKQSTTFLFDFIKGPWKTMVQGTMETAGPLRGQIITMGSLFFGVAFVVMVFTALGIFFEFCGKYTNCTGCKFIDTLDDKLGAWLIYFAWCFSFIFIIFLFILCAILLPVGVVISDVCVVIDDMPNDFEGYLGPNLASFEMSGTTPAGILDGCFGNSSLFVILNMTGAFSFKDSLTFGSSDSFNSTNSFSFSKFDSMHAQVHSLTYNNFSAPGSSMDDDIATAEQNNQTATANELKTVRSNSNKTVAWMKRDIDHIQDKINQLQLMTEKFQSDINGSKPYALEIVDSAMKIAEGGNCGFIKNKYENVGKALCGRFLVSILQLALYCCLAGVFGLPMVFANLQINKRFGGHGEFKEGEENDGDDLGYGPVRGLTFQRMKTSIFGGGANAATVPIEEQRPNEVSQQYVVAEEGEGENGGSGSPDYI